ncbi:SDS22 [Sanghuangporus sanghuang]
MADNPEQQQHLSEQKTQDDSGPSASKGSTGEVNPGAEAEVNGNGNRGVQKRTAVVVQPEQEHEHDQDADSDDGDHDGKEGEGAGEDEEDDDSYLLQDLPDDTDEISLIHAQLKSLQSLQLPRFGPYLKRLYLRQNLLKRLEPEVFRSLVELEELDFYDNRLKGIGDALNTCTKLNVLDLSFNLLRSVPDTLDHFPQLRTIYFVQNRISHITGLSSLGATLTSLELGGNKIRKIENLDALVNLEELWLGKNKISKLEGLSSLRRLKILSIQSNRLERIEGLEELEDLEEFYISHNGIKRLEGLEKNKKLRMLDVGNNFIEKIENLEELENLEEFWASNNKITTLLDLAPQLRRKKALETVYLEGNPVQRTEGAAYRRKISLALPQLKQIDATFVKPF